MNPGSEERGHDVEIDSAEVVKALEKCRREGCALRRSRELEIDRPRYELIEHCADVGHSDAASLAFLPGIRFFFLKSVSAPRLQ